MTSTVRSVASGLTADARIRLLCIPEFREAEYPAPRATSRAFAARGSRLYALRAPAGMTSHRPVSCIGTTAGRPIRLLSSRNFAKAEYPGPRATSRAFAAWVAALRALRCGRNDICRVRSVASLDYGSRLIRPTPDLRPGQPLPHAGFGIGMRKEIGNHGDAVGAGAGTPSARSGVMPPIATSGRLPMRGLPFGNARQALRRPLHGLEAGLVDGPQRDVVGTAASAISSSSGLCVLTPSRTPLALMAARRRRQVLLAQMHVVGAQRQGLAPVVVDDQLAAVARRSSPGCRRSRGGCARAGHPSGAAGWCDAERHEALQPGEVGHDRIEQVEAVGRHGRHDRSRSKNGVPATGVEGAAMSRISIRPAS